MPNFVSVVASVAELVHGEKLRNKSLTQSINDSLSLSDAPGTEAFASDKMVESTSVPCTQQLTGVGSMT